MKTLIALMTLVSSTALANPCHQAAELDLTGPIEIFAPSEANPEGLARPVGVFKVDAAPYSNSVVRDILKGNEDIEALQPSSKVFVNDEGDSIVVGMMKMPALPGSNEETEEGTQPEEESLCIALYTEAPEKRTWPMLLPVSSVSKDSVTMELDKTVFSFRKTK